MDVHLKEKTFGCGRCGRRFSRKDGMKRHEKFVCFVGGEERLDYGVAIEGIAIDEVVMGDV